MTEGPGAHLIADRMRRALEGRRLDRLLWTRKDGTRWPAETFRGRRVERVECHGKEIFVHLDQRQAFRIHLLMHGHVRIQPDSETLASEIKLGFWTGATRVAVIGAPSIELLSAAEVHARKQELGPDATATDFDAGRFRRNLQAKGARTLSECLLDQEVVAGVGNMWKSEILFEARLDPRRTADTLDLRARSQLAKIVPAFLRRVYESKRRGQRTRLKVYHRAGKPCMECGTPIEGYRVGGRMTFSCPRCQAGQRTL